MADNPIQSLDEFLKKDSLASMNRIDFTRDHFQKPEPICTWEEVANASEKSRNKLATSTSNMIGIV